jgi:hypothetical protein
MDIYKYYNPFYLMKKKRKLVLPAEERQLSLVFHNLSPRIPDANDYGTIIGYTIFNALNNFHLITSSQEERIFREVKRTYDHFEDLLKKLDDSQDYLPSLCELQNKTESTLDGFSGIRIQPITEIPIEGFEGSWIFNGILDTLFNRGGNPLDRLRRYGLELDRTVQTRGVIRGNRSCLQRDYRDLYSCFVREKGDRRE